jgi:virginiamycin B lyase
MGPVGAAYVASGADRALWATLGAGNVGRMTTDGVFTDYQAPTPTSTGHIVPGPDGAVWLAAQMWLERVAADGTYTRFPLPQASNPNKQTLTSGGFVLGPDGAFWFGVYVPDAGYRLARMTLDGLYSEFPTTFPVTVCGLTTGGPRGELWFTECNYDTSAPDLPEKIGRVPGNVGPLELISAGVLTEFALPAGQSAPHSVTLGLDGAIWCTTAHAVVRIWKP